MRAIKITFLLFTLIVSQLLFNGCDRKPIDKETGLHLSVGSYRRITVLSDSRVWLDYENDFVQGLGRRIYTPSLEYIFNVDPLGYEDFKTVQHRKLLFFIADLTSSGSVSAFVRENLDPKSIQVARDEGGKIFFVKDLWAKDQVVMFLVARNHNSILEVFEKDKEKMFSILDNFYIKNIKEGLYNYAEQVDLERRLYSQYGWHFRVPRGYEVIGEYPDERFIWFRKRSPDRIIFVYWEDAPENKFTPEFCLDIRDSLAFNYYEEDEIVPEKVSITQTEFLGMPAYQIDGFWQNFKYLVGGPFKTYCFYSEEQKRIYIFDTCIYAPGEGKYIQQKRLESIAHSFTTQPVPADRRSKEPGEVQ